MSSAMVQQSIAAQNASRNSSRKRRNLGSNSRTSWPPSSRSEPRAVPPYHNSPLFTTNAVEETKEERGNSKQRKEDAKAQAQKFREILSETRRKQRFVIDPETNRYVKLWDLWLVVLLVYTCLLTPYEMAFLKTKQWDLLFNINRIVDIFFFMDMGVNFFLIYYDPNEGKMIRDQRRIVIHYLRRWFIIDIFATFPYEMLNSNSEEGSNTLFSYLRLLRALKLLRMFRVTRIVARWQADYGIRYSIASLWYLLLGMMLLAHWGACIWGMIPALASAEDYGWMGENAYGCWDDAAWTKYVVSLYWSVMTLTTIGYGDVGPKNDAERFFAVILMLIGGCMYAYIVGAICNIISRMNIALFEFRGMMDNLNQYMQEMEIDQENRISMRRYFIQNQSRFRHMHHAKVLEQMSPGLQKDFSSHANRDWFEKLSFFKCEVDPKEEDMLCSSIIQRLQPESFPAQEHMIEIKERALKMYVVKRGLLATRGLRRQGKGNILRRNDVIGEDIILNWLLDDPRRAYCVMCVTFVDVFSLHREDLRHIFEFGEYPHLNRQMRRASIKMALRIDLLKRAEAQREMEKNQKAEQKRQDALKQKQNVNKKLERPSVVPDEEIEPLTVVAITNRLEKFLCVMRNVEIVGT